MHWRDIVTDCKRSDGISKKIIVLPSGCFLGFKGRACVDVSHWSSVFRAHFEENRLDFLEVFFCVLLFVDDEFLEDHVVLSERACFISEDVRDSPELFWDVGVARDCAFDCLIVLYLVGEHCFREIVVDS